jgi:hypothetical protein
MGISWKTSPGVNESFLKLGSFRYESGRERVLKMKTLRKLPCPTYLFGPIQMVGFWGLVYVQGVVLGMQVRSEVG